ncbi:MAG: endospore coat-associated protein YheC/D, partial [Paenibacillus sp.]|nr:endospore coat-associated protein YheC/D [Paenibacillus sp.]
MQAPYVGILVNDKLYRSIPLGKTKYEAVKLYAEAGKKLGFTPCFFRLQDFRAGQTTVRAYVINDDTSFVRKTVPAPQVIHNRAIYTGKQPYRKLRSWVKSGTQLFNGWNRYGKLRIQDILMQEPTLRPHLPGTYEANAGHVQTMMKLYDTLIIKPDKSSIGLGVMKLERKTAGWKLTYPVRTGPYSQTWRTLHFRGQ